MERNRGKKNFYKKTGQKIPLKKNWKNLLSGTRIPPLPPEGCQRKLASSGTELGKRTASVLGPYRRPISRKGYGSSKYEDDW
ncbi:Hypothetical predicted protein [Olea europaea subsp. europaea]|uniref:Uncharacterized protein n=1 Tax=Olea europaea subsp. europaea TaxID=158383 RepID=A0A8S0UAH9_OLEEU|nr:Hypothetical predicted protein [Olea europaea subsp. europaea]